MSSASITVDLNEVTSGLDGIYQAAANIQPALKNIGEYLAPKTQERIREEISPDGKPYTPLNPFYALHKKGPGILRGVRGESGGLAEISYQLASESVDVSSAAPYAATHQFGAVIKPKTAAALVFSLGGNKKVVVASVTIPARPFLGISGEDELRIREIVMDHFVVGAAGETP